MGGVLRSNWAWAVILGKSLGSSELQDQSNRAWEHMFGRTWIALRSFGLLRRPQDDDVLQFGRGGSRELRLGKNAGETPALPIRREGLCARVLARRGGRAERAPPLQIRVGWCGGNVRAIELAFGGAAGAGLFGAVAEVFAVAFDFAEGVDGLVLGFVVGAGDDLALAGPWRRTGRR